MSSQGPGKGSAKGVLPAPPQAFLAKRRQDCYFCYLPCFFMLSSAGQGSARLHHLLLARIHLQPLPLPLQPQHLRGAWLPSRLQYPPLLQVSSHVAPPDFGAEAACFSIVQPTLFRFSAQGSLHTASFSQLRWSSRVLGLVARRAGWHVAFRGAWWLLLFPPSTREKGDAESSANLLPWLCSTGGQKQGQKTACQLC